VPVVNATSYLSIAALAERLIGEPVVARRWAEDSALAGYTVGGLAGHLARAVLTVDRYLDGEVVSGVPVDAAGYFVRVLGAHDPLTSELHTSVRARAMQEAADGPGALVERLGQSRRALHARLAEVDPAAQIAVLDDTVMSVESYLETRMVELVVHIDDLAVSVGRDIADDIEPRAYATVAAALAQLAAAREGGLATVRSLARRERQPEAVRAL
jgi:hypothetical protein